MAPQEPSYDIVTLKAVTYRLTTTPTQQLLNVVPHLSAQLATCKAILSAPHVPGSKDGAEISALVHKFRTRISSLLQDRSVEGRWAGIVMAKAAVELGGHEILQSCVGWIRSMLGIWNKADPATTKKQCIVTITRIFVLAREYATLVREIITPNLPSLVAACLQILNASGDATGMHMPLVETVLKSLSQLIRRHPTIFRTYTPRIREALLQHLAPTSPSSGNQQSSPPCVPEHVQRAAQTLYVQLHESAMKNASSEEWETSIKNIVTTIHQTTDEVFRSVHEDWESVAGYHPVQHNIEALQSIPARFEKDLIGLGSWSGISAGADRISELLGLLQSYLQTATSFSVSLKVGLVVDLLKRLFSMARPHSPRDWEVGGRADTRFEKSEREELALLLPGIHIAAIKASHSLLKRLGTGSFPIISEVQTQILWIFGKESSIPRLRAAVYACMGEMLLLFGSSLTKHSIEPLKIMVSSCCSDLFPHSDSSTSSSLSELGKVKMNGVSSKKSEALLDSSQPSSANMSNTSESLQAAFDLLPALLAHLPAEVISKGLRAAMDRAAILTQHKQAMLASVQNPSAYQASILPLLARLYSDDLDLQSLLKPRMPVVLQHVDGVSDDGHPAQEDTVQIEHSGDIEYPEMNANSMLASENALPTMTFGESLAAQKSALSFTCLEPPHTLLADAIESQIETSDSKDLISNKRTLSPLETAESEQHNNSKRAKGQQAPDFAPDQVVKAKDIVLLDQEDAASKAQESPVDIAESSRWNSLRTGLSTVETGDAQQDIDSDDDDDNFEVPKLTLRSDSDSAGEDYLDDK